MITILPRIRENSQVMALTAKIGVMTEEEAMMMPERLDLGELKRMMNQVIRTESLIQTTM